MTTQSPDKDDLDLLAVPALLRPRLLRLIVAALAGAVLVGVMAVAAVPRRYQATASVFVVSQTSSLTSALRLPALMPWQGAGNEADRAESVLLSRSLRERLVERFDLVHVYRVRDAEQALRALADNIAIERRRGDLLSITVTTKGTPIGTRILRLQTSTGDEGAKALAAEMANSCVESLTAYLDVSSLTAARKKREFIERRLRELGPELEEAEVALAKFLADSQVGELDSYTRNLVGEYLRLSGQLATMSAERESARAGLRAASKELAAEPAQRRALVGSARNPVLDTLREREAQLQLDIRRLVEAAGRTREHPEVVALEKQLEQTRQAITEAEDEVFAREETAANPVRDALREEQAQQAVGAASAKAAEDRLAGRLRELEADLAGLSPLATRYAQLMRKVEVKRQAYATLSQEVETARAQEVEETLAVEWLDRAVPPLRKSSPSLSKTLVGAFLILFALFGAWTVLARGRPRKSAE